MNYATDNFLAELESKAEEKKKQILSAEDNIKISGTSYFVSNNGNDANDGLSPASPWCTLKRVSDADLAPGDGVFFQRGDLFRGTVITKPGVTYAAYGNGEKPKFHGGEKSLADPDLWEIYDSDCNIWRLKEPIHDCGTLVFNCGEAHSRKLIPSYINGRFVCRDDENKVFNISDEMTNDLDLVCIYDDRLSTEPSKGECFPIPKLDDKSLGTLYLRCDNGNPGTVFDEIEALPRKHMFCVWSNDNVTIDNLCIKYVGMHGIAAGGQCVKGLCVSNCEIGWIGGTIQGYEGTDPNYPQGKRGTVTRFGNAIEIYGGCDSYTVENCYIYQVYDAGITHQVTTNGYAKYMKNIKYSGNLVENCVYSIEYFLDKTEGDTQSYIENCEISDNFLRFSGYGWGQQRHNTYTSAHIKGWSYENTAKNYTVHNNIFDRAAMRMLHLVAWEQASCPKMYENVYIQHLGHTLGQYGSNNEKEPPNLSFDEHTRRYVRDVFGDTDATVYFIK